MIDLQVLNNLDETISRLKGFGVLLSSNEVRDAMPQETATGLEYIYMDIVERFDTLRTAINRNK